MHRISYDGAGEHGELQRSVTAAINREIMEFCSALEFSRHEIYEIVVDANTTMRDILFKFDVQTIGQKPYKSLVEHEFTAGKRHGTALMGRARKLGFLAVRICIAPHALDRRGPRAVACFERAIRITHACVIDSVHSFGDAESIWPI